MDCGALFKLMYSLESIFRGQCHKDTNNFIRLKVLGVTLRVFFQSALSGILSHFLTVRTHFIIHFDFAFFPLVTVSVPTELCLQKSVPKTHDLHESICLSLTFLGRSQAKRVGKMATESSHWHGILDLDLLSVIRTPLLKSGKVTIPDLQQY